MEIILTAGLPKPKGTFDFRKRIAEKFAKTS